MIKKLKRVIVVLSVLLILVTALLIISEIKKEPIIYYSAAYPFVMVNNKLYYCRYNKIVDPPEESQIAGRITNYIPQTRVPNTNDTSNTICCVNQPYAFVDGDLIVYAVNVHLSGALPEHTVDAWFYCEPHK